MMQCAITGGELCYTRISSGLPFDSRAAFVHYSVELHIASVLQRFIKLGSPQLLFDQHCPRWSSLYSLTRLWGTLSRPLYLTKVRNHISDYRIFVSSGYPFRDNQNPQPDLLNYSLRQSFVDPLSSVT